MIETIILLIIFISPFWFLGILYKLLRKKERLKPYEFLIIIIGLCLPTGKHGRLRVQETLDTIIQGTSVVVNKVQNTFETIIKDEEKPSEPQLDTDRYDKTAEDRVKQIPNKLLNYYREYAEIMSKAAKDSGIPLYYLAGGQALDGTGFISVSPVLMPGHCLNVAYYGKKAKDGTTITLKTYGQKYFSEFPPSCDTSSKVVQIFGLLKGASWTDANAIDGNKDGTKDPYNFYDSAYTAGKHIKNLINQTTKITGYNENQVQAGVFSGYNAGATGWKQAIPPNELKYFSELLNKGMLKNNNRQLITEALKGGVYNKEINGAVTNLFLDMGFALNKDNSGFGVFDRSKLVMNTKIPTVGGCYNANGDVIYVGTRNSCPSGYINSGACGNRYGVRSDKGCAGAKAHTNGTMGGYLKLGSQPTDKEPDGKQWIVISRESGAYIVKGIAAGYRMESEINAFLRKGSTTNYTPHFGLIRKKQDRFTKPIYEESTINTVDELAVGNKGEFPIYPQTGRWNNHRTPSAVSWKWKGSEYFNSGEKVNLGNAGCSLISMTSMIHGLGLGNKPIPIMLEKGKIEFPTLENMSNILTSGPVIGQDAEYLGYKVKYIDYSNSKDELFYELLKGIPYVVNVVNSPIDAYDQTGKIKIETTNFTYGGHFIILKQAYEIDGKRFVEIVNSNRFGDNRASINDQNKVLIDFDSMINNHSFLEGLPAYTITGTDDVNVNLQTDRWEKDYTDDIIKQKIDIDRLVEDAQVKIEGEKQYTEEELREIIDREERLKGRVLKTQINTYTLHELINLTTNNKENISEVEQILAPRDFTTSFVEYNNEENLVIPVNKYTGFTITATTNKTNKEQYKKGDFIGKPTKKSQILYVTLDINKNKWKIIDKSIISDKSL